MSQITTEHCIDINGEECNISVEWYIYQEKEIEPCGDGYTTILSDMADPQLIINDETGEEFLWSEEPESEFAHAVVAAYVNNNIQY